MTAKDFLNFKKPHFWTALVIILVLIFAVVVSVLDKEEEITPVDVPPAAEVEVEVEEVPEEPEKSDWDIIIERFSHMDWSEVGENAKVLGEEGWEDGIVILAELPEEDITLYGYNDEEYKYMGVAIDHQDNVNFFEWTYISEEQIAPEMYWNADAGQLQVTLNLYDGSGVNAEELHVLQEYETMTLEDFIYRSSDYLAEIEEQLAGTGMSIGTYVDIKLGETMMLQFKPVKTVDGVEEIQKMHQAVIYLNPSKDGFEFELGNIGVEPEKRTATITIEGIEEEYTEIQYQSEDEYTIWYPETLTPTTVAGHTGFLYAGEGEEPGVQVLIVPEYELEHLNESYLKEAAGNFKSSGEYKKVTVSKVKTLKSESKNVTIKMIEVVHDDTADRFYIVQGKKEALLITVSMSAESLEGWGKRINAMIQTITFIETE